MSSDDDPATAAARLADQWNEEGLLADLETRHVELQRERDEQRQRAEALQGQLSEVQSRITAQEAKLRSTESELASARRDQQIQHDKRLTVEGEQKTQQERMDRMEAEADALREEISRLTESNSTMTAKLAEADTKKMLSSSAAIPLQYESDRLRKELDSLTSHSQWLESELATKTDQLASTRTEHSHELIGLRAELDKATADRDAATSNQKLLLQNRDELQSKVEQLSSQLFHHKQEANDVALATQEEVTAERRLVELQKEQLTRMEQRHKDVVAQMESMKKLASQAATEQQENLERVRNDMLQDSRRVLEEQARDHRNRINELEDQLREANRRRTEAEDGLMASPRGRLIRPIAASTAGTEEEPLGLTECYSRLAETEDALRVERTERKRAELYLQKIQADLEAQAPVLLRQRQEYELAMSKQDEMQTRLDEALDEVRICRSEESELREEASLIQKKVSELEQENTDLAKQVQALLRSRAGGDVESISWDDSTGDDIPICISIEEIQNQNQRLLREHRRLTNTVSELEEKLRTDPLRTKLEATEKELSDLREQREHQEKMVAQIVQQRDLFRALLASHNIVGGEGGTGSEDVAALVRTQQQTEKTQAIEQRNKELESDLAKARAELSSSSSTHEAMEDRIARYDAHTTELTSSVTKLEGQLTSANATVARSEADAAYHRDKCVRTEESLRLARDEIVRANDAKREMQSVNEELQKAASAANIEAGRREQQVRQAETKLRLAETQLRTAKAAETRLALEANSLRSDVARQGALLDSVQRIEASLSAKNEEDKTKLTEEAERLSQNLVTERSKHAVELENLHSRIRELELDVKSLENKKDEALSELVAAKKESLCATSEMQALVTKISRLEAELHSTKKKLGDEDGEGDEEMNLQTQIDTLTADLEAAREELAASKERVTNYQNMAKASENALAELNETAEAFKKAHFEETEQLKKELEAAKKESGTKQEFISELTKDLANHRDEQETTVSHLKDEVAVLKGELETAQKDAESATARVAAMASDITSYRSEATMAQNNYERELALHAAARTSLRSARAEADAELRLRKSAEEQVDIMNAEFTQERKVWDEEKASLEGNIKELQKNLEETRSQNNVLHSQLETLGDLVGKNQSEKIDSLSSSQEEKGESPEERAATAESIDELTALRTSVSEYREVVRFMRSEREMFQAQLDSARRTAERERAASAVTRQSLDDARAELELLQNSRGAPGDSTSTAPAHTDGAEAVAEKLQQSEEQLTLLRESNKLLREESEKMEKTLAATQSELAEVTRSFEPTEQKARRLEVDKAVLEEEKASLARETDAWKGRVHSLVSKFHQIDPAEHEKALKQVEGLQKECDELKSQKASAEKESTSAKGMLIRLNKELSQQRALVEGQKKTISRISSEKEVVSKSSKAAVLITKERDQLKEQNQKLKSEAASRETELKGAIERNESLKTRLRQFQKMITETRAKQKAQEKEIAVFKAKEKERSAAAPPKTIQKQEKEAVAQQPPAASAAKAPAATIAKVVQKEEGAELPHVPPGGFRFGPGGRSVSTTEVVPKTETTSQPLMIPTDLDQPKGSVDWKEDVAPSVPAAPEASGDISKPSTSVIPVAPSPATPVEETPGSSEAKKSVPAKPAKTPVDTKGAMETKVDTSGPQKRKVTATGKGQELSLREKLMQKKRKLAEELKKAGEERTSPPRKRIAVMSSEDAGKKAVPVVDNAPDAVDKTTPLSPEAKPWAPPADTGAPAEVPSQVDSSTAIKEAPSSETTASVVVAMEESSQAGPVEEPAQTARPSETTAPVPAEEPAQAAQTSETTPVPAEEPSTIEPAAKAPPVSAPSPQESSEPEPATAPAPEQETVQLEPASTAGDDKEEEDSTPEAAEAEAVSESKPTSIFGSSTPAFGSGGGFGSGAPFGSSTAFGKAAGVPPMAFGSSPTLMTKPSQSVTGFGTKPSGGGTSPTPAFGSGGAFLNLKPPGSTSAPLTFGSSATIKLPTPSKTLAAASTTFGAFGQPVSTSPSNPFGGGTPSQAKPLFGDVGLKRAAPEDEEEKESLKMPRIETEAEATDEVNKELDSEDDAEVVEGEI